MSDFILFVGSFLFGATTATIIILTLLIRGGQLEITRTKTLTVETNE